MSVVFSASTLVAVMAGLLAGLLCPAIFASVAMRACNPPRRAPLPTTRVRPHGIVTLATTCQARWVERRMAHTTISPGAVAEWCDALARSLRAGTTLSSALMSIEPADPALAHRSQSVRQALGRGAIVSTAVIGLRPDPASRPQRQSPHLALAAAVLATSGSIGGPAAASLDRLAGALRLRVADGQERSAHSSQARLSAHVLTFVPLTLLGLLAATDSDVRAVLSQPTGIALVSIGLALNLVGWWCLGVVGVAAVGPIPAAILTVVGFAAVRTRALLAARSATSAQIAALPDAIDAFVFLVHAGLTPQLAIERLVNEAPPITQPAFADALAALNTHFDASALAFVDLVAASSRYGLPMADVLTQLSVETRATRRHLDEAAARALPVKLSFPLVVCTLPSFVLLAIAPAVLAALSSLGNNAW